MATEDIKNKEFSVPAGMALHSDHDKIPVYYRMRTRLLLLITLSVFITEILIFMPAIASMQQSWLEERHQSAKAISLILAESPNVAIGDELKNEVLFSTDALAISVIDGSNKRELASSSRLRQIDEIIDLSTYSETKALLDSLTTLYFGGNKTLLVRGPIDGTDMKLEVTISDNHLRDAMIQFTWHFFVVSITIAIVAATLIYLIIHELLVRPLQKIYMNMLDFVIEPHNPSRIMVPETRRDELGLTQRRISVIESELQKSYAHQKHLANLGLAVSKINHDMRNILASAQLMSDHLSDAKDPMVQKIAPKLIKAIDRAVIYSQSVISYGRTQEAAPKRERFALRNLVDDVFESLTITGSDQVTFCNLVADDIMVDADSEQLHRVITNLCRNAIQAMIEHDDNECDYKQISIRAERIGACTVINVDDTGPGLPEQAKQHLFTPFQGSTSLHGTGLGLTICEELIHAHGGTIKLLDDERKGAHFEIRIPDTSASLNEWRKNGHRTTT